MVQDGTHATHNLSVSISKPQPALCVAVSSVLGGVESVHLVTDKNRDIHITILVQVYGEPEKLFLVLVCEDLLNLNHQSVKRL